ncbi:hypothetical protein OG594_42185 [Streptomyces sp. NBC_01214]|uniref:hypothetical protein n=1 Tax=Streptomyces sp. NBC_01214 TaxID=2903777 RepID=UPI002254812B|nr:hypothetical protein [Streptomyces sp. NBC_01214]MCX4808128.1 hypothetical protein [Streptomyces sp. NBC_01214]
MAGTRCAPVSASRVGRILTDLDLEPHEVRGWLTRRVLRHGDFASREGLIERSETYAIGHNETAEPYRWTDEGTPLKAA